MSKTKEQGRLERMENKCHQKMSLLGHGNQIWYGSDKFQRHPESTNLELIHTLLVDFGMLLNFLT